jgi:hypothetical protein
MEQLARAQTMALRMATLGGRVSPALSSGRRLSGEAGSTRLPEFTGSQVRVVILIHPHVFVVFLR